MKTLLIATDFSNASRNASVYGVELARALNAKIILFNAFKVPAQAPALTMGISRYDIMMQIDKRLLEEADFLDPKREIIEVMCDEGPAADNINTAAHEKNADFIIAGMKGGSKNVKRIFGSTVTTLIKKSNTPVIIIPEEAEFSAPKIISYASDILLDNNIKPVDQISSLTKTFNSKLYIVRVVQDQFAEIFERLYNPGNLRDELKKTGASFQFPVDTNVTHALNDFVTKHQVDMLVMMPHKHEWLERMFKKSETKDMAFHARVPLLILPQGANQPKKKICSV